MVTQSINLALPLTAAAVLAAAGCSTTQEPSAHNPVFFQAHRGGLDEVPENTLAAFAHAWSIPGAIPETDVRTTSDGVMICLHDETLARITNAPEDIQDVPVSQLTFEQIQPWDASGRFAPQYTDQHVPTLRDLLGLMREDAGRRLYLEIKDADLNQLKQLLDEYGVTERMIFIHGDPATCGEIQRFFDGAPTMTWLSGPPEDIRAGFARIAQGNFAGVSQLQLHLRAARTEPSIEYVLDADFLREAVAQTRAAGVDLQVRPFRFDPASLRTLMDLGIRWYVADAPRAFADAVARAQSNPKR